jgi:hypothetical protein
MRPIQVLTCTGLTAALALAGCSGGSGENLLTTSSINQPQKVAAKPSVDPVCASLSNQINATRQEGTPARVNAVSTGKTRMVTIKRASLAKMAELDRLNNEFQAKCSKVPMQQTAAVASTAPPASQLSIKKVDSSNAVANRGQTAEETARRTQELKAAARAASTSQQ